MFVLFVLAASVGDSAPVAGVAAEAESRARRFERIEAMLLEQLAVLRRLAPPASKHAYGRREGPSSAGIDRTNSRSNRTICIAGSNHIERRSAGYWHFAQGTLAEAWAQLQRQAADVRLGRGDQLVLGRERHFPLSNRDPSRAHARYHPLFQVLFDAPPLHRPRGCHAGSEAGAKAGVKAGSGAGSSPQLDAARTDGGWLTLTLPELRKDSLARGCMALPALRARALASRARWRPRSLAPHRAPQGDDESRPVAMHLVRGQTRTLRNAAECTALIRAFASRHGLEYAETNFDTMPLLAQVDRMLDVQLFVSMHGAGVGVSHFWMCGTHRRTLRAPAAQHTQRSTAHARRAHTVTHTARLHTDRALPALRFPSALDPGAPTAAQAAGRRRDRDLPRPEIYLLHLLYVRRQQRQGMDPHTPSGGPARGRSGPLRCDRRAASARRRRL